MSDDRWVLIYYMKMLLFEPILHRDFDLIAFY